MLPKVLCYVDKITLGLIVQLSNTNTHLVKSIDSEKTRNQVMFETIGSREIKKNIIKTIDNIFLYENFRRL